MAKPIKRNKYNAKKTIINVQGEEYEFPSKAEANRFVYLVDRLKRGEISKLSTQPSFKITEDYDIATDKTKSGKSRIGALKYTPDFKYVENGKTVVEEVKGFKSVPYVLRLKLFLKIAYNMYKVDTFIEVIKGKETRYECASVNLKKAG